MSKQRRDDRKAMRKHENAESVSDNIYEAAIRSHKIEEKIIGKTREVPEKYRKASPILNKSSFINIR